MKDNKEKLSEVVMDFRNHCDPKFHNIVDVFWDQGVDRESGETVYEIHVVIEEKEAKSPKVATYCYPVANFGRKRGLYLWDTVTMWEHKTVKLRFRFE